MFSFTEQFSALTKTQIETQLKILNTFASKTFEGAQQVIALNLSATKTSVDKTSAAARQLLEAKDPREFFSVSASQAPNFENVLAYSRELFSIASRTQAELVQTAKEQISEVAAAVKPLALAAAPIAVPASAPAPAPEPVAAAPAPAPAPAAAAPAPAPVAAAPAPAEPVSAPAAAPKAAAKAETKSKPATVAKQVAEAVAKLADEPTVTPAAKPAAAPMPESKPVVLKSVEPAPAAVKPAPAKQLDVQAGKSKK